MCVIFFITFCHGNDVAIKFFRCWENNELATYARLLGFHINTPTKHISPDSRSPDIIVSLNSLSSWEVF